MERVFDLLESLGEINLFSPRPCPRRNTVITACIASLCFSAVSQELDELSIEELFDVKVMELASGVKQQVNKAPAVVSVITAEEIKAYGATSLFEALEIVPGLHVVPSSLTNMKPAITFRGIYTDNNPQVLVLIDGHRVSYSHEGGFMDNVILPLSNVKKIEVIRGPASALHGSDAYAGVVNLVTYGRNDPGQISASVGSFNHKGVSARTNLLLSQGWVLSLSGEYLSREPDTSRIITSDTQSLFDSLFGTNASLAPGYIDDGIRQIAFMAKASDENWLISYTHLDMDAPTMTGVANSLNTGSDIDHTMHSWSASYDSKDFSTSWQFKPNIAYFNIDSLFKYQIFPDQTVLPIGSDGNVDFTNPAGFVEFSDGLLGYPGIRYEVVQAELPATRLGQFDHQTSISLGYRIERSYISESKNFGPGLVDGTEGIVDASFLTDVSGSEFVFLTDNIRRVFHLGVQDIWQVNDTMELTLGLRFDDFSDVGSTLTPRAILVWELNDKLTTKFIYGSAFRAPAFAELFAQNNPAGVGNPNLGNETIDSYETSLSYIINADSWINLNLYHFEADSIIQFVPVPDETVSSTENTNKLQGKGLEAELFWQLADNVELSLNYAYQSTKNALAGIQQPFVPKQQVFAMLNWQVNQDWKINLSTRGILDRQRESDDTRAPTDDYWLTNINFQYQLGNWRLNGTIKNLFNSDAREPASIGTNILMDFPLNERNGFIEVTWQF